jgi:hypothetical protein
MIGRRMTDLMGCYAVRPYSVGLTLYFSPAPGANDEAIKNFNYTDRSALGCLGALIGT